MEDFLSMVFKFLTRPDNVSGSKKFTKAVRVKDGDVHLPNVEVLGRCLQSDITVLEELLNVSDLNRHLKAPWRVIEICRGSNHLVLKLDHGLLMRDCLKKILKDDVQLPSSQTLRVRIVNFDLDQRQLACHSQLSELRSNQVCQLLERLYTLYGHVIVRDEGKVEDLRLHVGGADEKYLGLRPTDFQGSIIVHKVGHVLDPVQHKKDFERTIFETYNDIIENCRCLAMEREPAELSLTSLERTACAEIQFQLLSGNISQPVIVSSELNNSDACFVLYNYARINLILETYRKGNRYPPIPVDVDFSLLDEPEEKAIFFDYILQYPSMLKSVVEESCHGNIRLHKIVYFLTGLSKIYSRYYNRVRVLRDPIDHLLPTIFARIGLLNVVKILMDHAFSLLGLVPNRKM